MVGCRLGRVNCGRALSLFLFLSLYLFFASYLFGIWRLARALFLPFKPPRLKFFADSLPVNTLRSVYICTTKGQRNTYAIKRLVKMLRINSKALRTELSSILCHLLDHTSILDDDEPTPSIIPRDPLAMCIFSRPVTTPMTPGSIVRDKID